jgi:hypothetical protein
LDYGALQSSNVFTNVNPGNHIVTVTDSNGCSNLSTTIPVFGYPTYFTPKGDGFNDFWNIIGLPLNTSSPTDLKVFKSHFSLKR